MTTLKHPNFRHEDHTDWLERRIDELLAVLELPSHSRTVICLVYVMRDLNWLVNKVLTTIEAETDAQITRVRQQTIQAGDRKLVFLAVGYEQHMETLRGYDTPIVSFVDPSRETRYLSDMGLEMLRQFEALEDERMPDFETNLYFNRN